MLSAIGRDAYLMFQLKAGYLVTTMEHPSIFGRKCLQEIGSDRIKVEISAHLSLKIHGVGRGLARVACEDKEVQICPELGTSEKLNRG